MAVYRPRLTRVLGALLCISLCGWCLTVAAAVPAALSIARKCRGESLRSRCLATNQPLKCDGTRVFSEHLCDSSTESFCCIPGEDDMCSKMMGKCVYKADNACPSGNMVDSLCPGSSRITCCVPAKVRLTRVELPGPAAPPPSAEDRVRNRIVDLLDLLLDNITKPTPHPVSGLCWPVARSSVVTLTATKVSFGSAREGGRSCHTGVDIMTQAPGAIVAVDEGQVVAVQNNFGSCDSGWGFTNTTVTSVQTSAVFVHHRRLNVTVNYGGVDPDSLRVHEGQEVRKGQPIGTTAYCGRLHFELYSGRVQRAAEWRPPLGSAFLPTAGNACAKRFQHTKPQGLLDPLTILRSVEGELC